jgi:hypothetical protein
MSNIDDIYERELNNMDKFEAIIDHYKDTFNLIKEHEKKRERYLFYVIIIIGIMIIDYAGSYQIGPIIINYLNTKYNISLSIKVFLIETFIWLCAAIVMIKYYQSVIYIERQYGYIHKLESILSKNYEDSFIFSREGINYKTDYPIFSNWIWLIYRIILPLLFIVIFSFKYYSDFSIIFRSIIERVSSGILFCMVIITILFSVIFMHFKKA